MHRKGKAKDLAVFQASRVFFRALVLGKSTEASAGSVEV